MVRQSLAKNIFREIKSSLGRYFAILLIIALGVGFFAGLRLTEPMMKKTAVNYLDETSFCDFRLLSTLGFTDSDVEAFSAENGIVAEGAYTADFIAQLDDGKSFVLRAHSVTKKVNVSAVKYGRMPERDDECVLDARYFGEDVIGNRVRVSEENDEETSDKLKYSEYTVVGTVYNPYYLNYERGTTSVGTGTVAAFVYIPEGGFESEVWHEIYLSADISAEAYSEEYDTELEKYRPRIENLLDERGEIRYENIKSDVLTEISEAKNELAENIAEYEKEKAAALEEFAAALEKLENGNAEIIAAENTLKLKKNELADGEKQLSDGFSALAESKRTLEDEKTSVYAEIEKTETELSENRKNLEDGIRYYTAIGDTATVAVLTQQLAEVNAGLEKVAAAKSEADASFAAAEKEISKNEALLNTKKAEAEKGKAELEAAEKETEAKKKELSDGYEEYYSEKAKADKEFDDALSKIDDAKAEIKDAEAKIADIEEPSLYLLDRKTNIGYVCFENDSTIVKSVSVVFPMFFLLIAILVCMTTMTRMVDECRGQIGTFKALGYGNFSIQCKFLVYSGSAAFIGWLFGYFVGTFAIPKLLWAVYGIMYGFADLEYVFDPVMFAICFAAAICCSCGAAYAACASVLRPVPATLIRPKSPKAGKKIWLEHIPFIWKRLGFLRKVSVRNIFRYKNRLFMMLLGIGGCTALLITGFGIRDSIQDVVAFQFEEIMKYDMSVTVAEGKDESVFFEIENTDGVESSICLLAESDDMIHGENQKSVNLLVAENNDFGDFVSFKNGKDRVLLPQKNETVISTGIAETLGISVGDDIILRDSDYNEITLKVSGIFDNYIYNYAVVSPDTYTDSFGKEFKENTVYLNVSENADLRQVSARLSDISGVSNVIVSEDTVTRMDSTMQSINYIVLLVLVCAGALAFIVIYNLTNINIEERIREIATIKVLGFRKGEVSAYVMREIIILTAAGAVIGLPCGKLLHGFVMSCIKVDLVTFQNKISLISYLLSLCLTFVFAFIINLFMAKRLDKIDMAASLKSAE